MTLIGIPLANNNAENSNISPHFGRAPFFGLYETDSEKLQIIRNESNHFGGTKHPVNFLVDNKVESIICNGIGKHAFNEFRDSNISIFKGSNKALMENIEAFKNDSLVQLSGEKTCEGQGNNHDHDHHH